jgi:DNA-binding transcriptional LysR family regulator
MQRGTLDDLLAFLAVGRERSFTRATAKLGVSQSALSHTIRALEARLGVRLLTRTTRSVSPTEAGERLMQTIGPRLDEIDGELAALSDFREKPAGTIRITAADYVADTLLWPKLVKFLRHYPDIRVEIAIDASLTDIVAQRFDAGVRNGEQVAKDMIAVRISPDMRMAVVGTPSYFRKRSIPRRPLCLGIREGRPRAEGARRRATRLQPHRPDAQRSSRGIWPRLCAGGPGATPYREGPPEAGAHGLVPALLRLSPLLPEPAPAFRGLRPAGRRPAASRVKRLS